MTNPNPERQDDSFAQLLADFDDGLRNGLTLTAQRAIDTDLQERLTAAADFLLVLESVWARPHTRSGTSVGPLHELPRQIGRFEIQRVLGSGGAGIVYLASDPLLGRDVAVKVPHLEKLLTSSLRQRFLREAQAAALLNHPNIIPILEVGEADQLCFIVYAYCSGPTLGEWLKKNMSSVPCRDAAALIERLADTIAHAHQRGVLHRDLKPANILLSASSGSDGLASLVPYVTDFGLAKFAAEAEEVTRTGAVLGTPAYMAPEQTRSAKDLGPVCDIWALGVMLYELLTHKRPFNGGTALDTMRSIQEQEPISPRQLRPDVPRDLETICLKCLAKDPSARYASAVDLAADLRRYLEGRPVRARPTPWLESLSKWCRRHPTAAALFAVLFISLTIGCIGVFAYIGQLEDLVAASEREKLAKKRQEDLLTLASKEQELARRLRYVSDIRSAFQAIHDKKPETARLFLNRWPIPTGPDERGLEWHVLNRQLFRHDRQASIALPDLERPVGTSMEKFIDSMHAFAMSRDCQYAASMRNSSNVDIHEIATGKKLVTIAGPAAEARFVQGLGFSPDGRILAIGYNRRFPDASTHPAITLYDWRRQSVLAAFDDRAHAPAKRPMDLIFAPHDDILIVGMDQNLRFFSVSEFPKKLSGYDPPPIDSVALSRDGSLVTLTNRPDAQVEIRAFPSFKLLQRVPWDGGANRHRLLFSDDGKQLLYGGHRALYITDTERPVPVSVASWNDDDAKGIALSPNAQWLHFATKRGMFETVDMRTGHFVLTEHGRGVSHLVVEPNTEKLFARTQMGGLRVVSANWPADPDFIDTKTGRLYALAYSPNGSLLASGGQRPGVRIYHAATGAEAVRLDCANEIFALTFSPDGNTLAAGGLDGLVHRWDTATWKPIAPLKGHGGRVVGLAFTPNSEQLLSTAWDKTCRLWHNASGSLVHVFDGPFDYFSALALSPDGSEFAWVGDNESAMHVWNLVRKEVRVLPFAHRRARGVCYAPDGRRMASSSRVGEVNLWDVAAGKILYCLDTHERGVRSLSFSPDGKVLASAGLDKVVKLWDSVSFLELATLYGPRDELRVLVWAPDGNTLAAAGHDGKIWLWRGP